MKYRIFGKTGLKTSALGIGTMRFPLIDEKAKEVDEEKAIELIQYSLEKGINYIDTAYTYHNGKSEEIVGRAIKSIRREDVIITTKCPVWEIENADDFERILEEQLKKINTNYIDCYLFHAIGEERWGTIKKLKLLDKMEKAKADGFIRHIGFSFHDEYNVFKDIINGYDSWEICQLQYNYVDIDKQAGKLGLQYAYKKGLGVSIMEPLHGGRLANPPKQVKNILSTEKSPVEWAFDFLWDQPEVNIILSGMSNKKQIDDNCFYAEKAYTNMLNTAEKKMFADAKKMYDTTSKVLCTYCNYCMPCAAEIDIPELMRIYNMSGRTNYRNAKIEYEKLNNKADNCIHCRRCEMRCPQKIQISKEMYDIQEMFKKEVPELDEDALKIKWPKRYKKIQGGNPWSG